MDFRRQIVTCLFSMLRLSFETQKVKENYAIFIVIFCYFFHDKLDCFLNVFLVQNSVKLCT